jgi:hypothetical protein
MIERLPYDSSSVLNGRGDVVPAANYLDTDGDIVEPPEIEDTEIYVPVEPTLVRKEEFERAEKEYEQRLDALADRRNGDYAIARIELAEHNDRPPERSMYGLPPDNEVEEDVLPAAVANAIKEDSLRQRINDIYNQPSLDPDAEYQKRVEALRQRALFRVREDRQNLHRQ